MFHIRWGGIWAKEGFETGLILCGSEHASGPLCLAEAGQNQSSSCSDDYADLREQSPHRPVIVSVRPLGRQPIDVAGFETERTGKCSCGCQANCELHEVQVAKSKPSKALRVTGAATRTRHDVCFWKPPMKTCRMSGCLGSDGSQRHTGGRDHEPKNDPDASGEDSTRLVAQREQDPRRDGRASLFGAIVSNRLGSPVLGCPSAVVRVISCWMIWYSIEAGGRLCPCRLFS